MAQTFDSSDVTKGISPAIHAGLNAHHVRYTFPSTISGSTTVNLALLQPGAKIRSAHLSHSELGGGAQKWHLQADGHTYITTATPNNAGNITFAPAFNAVNHVMTASTNVQLVISAGSATICAAPAVDLTLLYTKDLDP